MAGRTLEEGSEDFAEVNYRRLTRWLLVVPAAVFAWYLVFVVGLFTHGFVEDLLCPAGQMVSGMCTNRSVQLTLRILVYIFVALSAIAVECTAVGIAPSHRATTAWIAFVAGSGVAAALGVAGAAYGEAVVAITSGLVTVMTITRYQRL